MENILTKKQQKVLNVIKFFISKNRFSPTLKELMNSLRKTGMILASLNSLVQYLNKLEENGYIQRFPGVRGIRLLGERGNDFVKIPLLGNADCGEPLSFANDIAEDYINISKKIVKNDKSRYFFVRAIGDSMNKEGIDSGDYVLIKRGVEPQLRENVLVIVNGLGAIKKFIKKGDSLMLVPNSTNPRHRPIILHPDDASMICGRVEKVFKNPQKIKP